jgi:Fe-S-cluster-containing dehydrogenase component
MDTARYGLLIDYEFCTGCHTCEVACKMEYGLPTGKYGIKIAEIGPWQITDDKWQLSYIPVPTDQCNLCADRVSRGKKPSCVHNRQSGVMMYGPVKELAKKMEGKPRMVLFTPK